MTSPLYMSKDTGYTPSTLRNPCKHVDGISSYSPHLGLLMGIGRSVGSAGLRNCFESLTRGHRYAGGDPL